MTTLPNGWRATTLGAIGDYYNGRAFKKSEWSSSGRPIIRIQNLTGSSTAHNFFEGEVDERNVARPGDLLIAWAATLGAHIWQGPEGVINQHIFKVRSLIDQRFHLHLINYRLDEMMRQAHGSGIVHVTRGVFNSIPVLVPSPSEQRRIIDVLEDHLSRLDAAGAAAVIAGRRADALRRKAMLDAVRDASGHARPLHEWLDLSIGGIWGSDAGVEEVDVQVLRVTELRPWGRLDPSTATTRSCSAKQYAGRSLQAGDLLLEKSGGGPSTPVGRVGLVTTVSEPSICSNFMQLMRPDAQRVVREYLHLALNVAHIQGRTHHMQKASTNIRNIKASEYLRMSVAVPSREYQLEAVARVAAVSEAVQHMQSAAAAARRRGQGLRRALLQAAFTGRLTGRSSDVEVVEELAASG